MASIDGLRQQVEELKQRLNDPASQTAAEPGELKSRLDSIKADLEGKQEQIVELSTEKQQLAAEKDRLQAENEQLRTLLNEVLSALNGQQADPSSQLLSEFLAETGPLVEPNRADPETVIAAGPPADLAPDPAAAPEAPEDAAEAEEEESPALRRIMRRSRRAAG